MLDFTYWPQVGNLKDINKISRYTNSQENISEILPRKSILPLFENAKNILDYGCGIGRNAYYLGTKLKDSTVFGFDHASILSYAFDYYLSYYEEDEEPSNVILNSDWSELNQIKYDVTLCDTVFSCMKLQEVYERANELAKISSIILIIDRGFHLESRFTIWNDLEQTNLGQPYKIFNEEGVRVEFESLKTDEVCISIYKGHQIEIQR